MNEKHTVFPHQIDVARRLSKYFSQVNVISCEYVEPTSPLPSNVQIHVSEWKYNQPIRNSVRFLRIFLAVLATKRRLVVFSHMTEVQSALISLITKVLNIRHYLWYAHSSRSLFLRWNSLFVSQIITSTPGSCPIKSRKVTTIGQSIDPDLFSYSQIEKDLSFNTWIHVGRIDPSKNIDVLLDLYGYFKQKKPNLTFDLYGIPTPGNETYFAEMSRKAQEIDEKGIRFRGPIVHSLIPHKLASSNLFVHAYNGSLDKVLVEAVMSGIPVVSCNKEFIGEFKTFGNLEPSETELLDFLIKEIEILCNLNRETIEEMLLARRIRAVANHSISNWIDKIQTILNSK